MPPTALGPGPSQKRDFSLRRPPHSRERMRKKKSACSVRNDGVAGAEKGKLETRRQMGAVVSGPSAPLRVNE